jgi:hypothetical protein
MGASRQIRKANGLAERLGRRHGVPVMVTWLSVQQHGAAQPFRRKDIAALLAAEGVYLYAAMAEHPERSCRLRSSARGRWQGS